MPGVGMTRMYPTIVLTSGGSWMEISATRSKVPHHTRGGGRLLNLWGPPVESIPHTEQSATWSKVPHHTYGGAHPWICGGHLLNLWGHLLNPGGHLLNLWGATSWICGATSSLLFVSPGISVISILSAYLYNDNARSICYLVSPLFE